MPLAMAPNNPFGVRKPPLNARHQAPRLAVFLRDQSVALWPLGEPRVGEAQDEMQFRRRQVDCNDGDDRIRPVRVRLQEGALGDDGALRIVQVGLPDALALQEPSGSMSAGCQIAAVADGVGLGGTPVAMGISSSSVGVGRSWPCSRRGGAGRRSGCQRCGRPGRYDRGCLRDLPGGFDLLVAFAILPLPDSVLNPEDNRLQARYHLRAKDAAQADGDLRTRGRPELHDRQCPHNGQQDSARVRVRAIRQPRLFFWGFSERSFSRAGSGIGKETSLIRLLTNRVIIIEGDVSFLI